MILHKITIYDFNGIKIGSELATDDEVQINLSELTSGEYLLNMFGRRNTITQKLIIK